jgi:hypothetical protein
VVLGPGSISPGRELRPENPRRYRTDTSNVDVDVVVDVDLDPSQALQAARTGRAECTAETEVRNVDGQGVAGGVHDHVHDYAHVHVVEYEKRSVPSTAFLHTL